MSSDDKRRISIKLTNGEVRKPGEVIPKSHVVGLKLETSPKLARGDVDTEWRKGTRVLVSGESYIMNNRQYPLMKEYGIVCVYHNGWLVPILRDAIDREKETLKETFYHPFKKTVKAGPEEYLWPVVEPTRNDNSD